MNIMEQIPSLTNQAQAFLPYAIQTGCYSILTTSKIFVNELSFMVI